MPSLERQNPCGLGPSQPMTGLRSRHRDGLTLYEFDHLAAFKDVEHGITTRHGGHSAAPFQELNLGLGVGDDPSAVARNRRRVFRRFGGVPVFLRQVHGVRVVTVSRKDGGPMAAGGAPPAEADALITDVPGLALVVLVADCQAVLLYDPVKGVVGNVHSGWRGSAGNVIGAAVGAMAEGFGCRPADIHAGVGPSLGPCCAEFIHFRRELPPAFRRYRVGMHHFDFWAASWDQLTGAGLRPDRIRIGRICSRCRRDDFYSYRAARITGRFAAVIGLR